MWAAAARNNMRIVPATLAAMFVQSYQTNMHIFPDWPTNQSAAFGNLNACGGFLVSSAITLGSGELCADPKHRRPNAQAGQSLAGCGRAMCFEPHRDRTPCRDRFSIIRPRWAKC